MKGLVEAMSEVAGRIVPGMSLFYQEQMLQRVPWDSFDSKKIWDSFDSKEIAVVKACPGWNDVPVRGAIVEVGHELYGRKKLLRRLVASNGCTFPAGVGSRATGLSEVRQSLRDAKVACRQSSRDPEHPVCRYDELDLDLVVAMVP